VLEPVVEVRDGELGGVARRPKQSGSPMTVEVAGPGCAACGELATHTAPFSSHWRRVHPSESSSSIGLREVPDPPVCERHWEDFLHRQAIPIGWCVDCEAYGRLATVSPCGRLFESF
jgi:hypothetical protein